MRKVCVASDSRATHGGRIIEEFSRVGGDSRGHYQPEEGIMKRSRHACRGFLVPFALSVVSLAGIAPGIPTLAQADEGKIEVVIKDDGYHVKGHTTPGALTRIILRNEGSMTHGFSSRILKDVQVRKEGDTREVVAHGVKSFHVDAGKIATLVFTKPVKHDPSTGISETEQYAFWCDLHPQMRGEFLIVETRGEVGGG